MEKMTFENKNQTITYYEWNDVQNPKGVIQIAHGMVEYAQRYDKIAQLFNQNGYIVVADDHRGHGNTNPESLGYCDGEMFFDTILDMKKLLDITKEKYPNLPYILFGFSYGSFLTQYFIGKYGNCLDVVIIGGSSKNSRISTKFGQFVAKIGCIFKGKQKPAKLIKKLTFNVYDRKFDDRCFLSTNKENNERYFNDPYCSFVCSYNFYYNFFKGLNKLYTKNYKNSLSKNLAMLIISGEDDPVGNMSKGTKKLFNYYQKVGCKNVQLKLYKDSRHEFLNEDNNRAYNILDFVNKNVNG